MLRNRPRPERCKNNPIRCTFVGTPHSPTILSEPTSLHSTTRPCRASPSSKFPPLPPRTPLRPPPAFEGFPVRGTASNSGSPTRSGPPAVVPFVETALSHLRTLRLRTLDDLRSLVLSVQSWNVRFARSHASPSRLVAQAGGRVRNRSRVRWVASRRRCSALQRVDIATIGTNEDWCPNHSRRCECAGPHEASASSRCH